MAQLQEAVAQYTAGLDTNLALSLSYQAALFHELLGVLVLLCILVVVVGVLNRPRSN